MRTRRDRLTAILMLAPSAVLLSVFVYGFVGQTLYVSMTDWGQGMAALAQTPDIHFSGLQTFRDLFSGFLDIRFRQDLVNMLYFTLLFVGGCLGVGLMLATLVDQGIRGESFFRTLFLFPMSLSFVVTGTIWRWLLQPNGGVNALPALAGLPRAEFLWVTSREQLLQFNWQNVPTWLGAAGAAALVVLALKLWRSGRKPAAGIAVTSAFLLTLWIALGAAAGVRALPFQEMHGFSVALSGVVVAAVWQMSGYTMALFLAGLRGIPAELLEAASVDGCSRLQAYQYVELPLLRPIIWSAVIILGHIALKSFDLIFAMAGPDNAATSVPAVTMYLTAFRGNQFAKGAAIAVILLAVVSVLIVPYLISAFRKPGERS